VAPLALRFPVQWVNRPVAENPSHRVADGVPKRSMSDTDGAMDGPAFLAYVEQVLAPT